MEVKYNLRYLPLFENDLNEIVDYFCLSLKNQQAAKDFIFMVEKAIQDRLYNPKAFEPYATTRQREFPYYRIYVQNFTIFYVVIDKIMEVRRIIYSKRDYINLYLP